MELSIWLHESVFPKRLGFESVVSTQVTPGKLVGIYLCIRSWVYHTHTSVGSVHLT